MTNTSGGTSAIPLSNATLGDEVSNASGGNAFAYKPSGGTQVTMTAATVQGTGGNQPHENIQPILCMTWIISLFGVFPSQT